MVFNNQPLWPLVHFPFAIPGSLSVLSQRVHLGRAVRGVETTLPASSAPPVVPELLKWTTCNMRHENLVLALLFDGGMSEQISTFASVSPSTKWNSPTPLSFWRVADITLLGTSSRIELRVFWIILASPTGFL